MGKTFSTGLLTDGIAQDSSNNIGIGGAVNASYKLTVTGTTLTTGAATFSSNVGVGISTPASLLQLYKSNSAAVIGKISDANLLIDSGDYGNSTYKGQIAFGYYTGSFTYAPVAIGFIPTTGAASGMADLTFYTRSVTSDTAPSERMRITSSGNVGISNTPSDWNTSFKPLQLGETAYIFGRETGVYQTEIGQNAYYKAGAGWTYIASTVAQRYLMDSSGGHIWYTAASGTAGNAISFNERMRITSGGNIGIGDTGATNVRMILKSATNSSSDWALMVRSSTSDLFFVRADGIIYGAGIYNNTGGGTGTVAVSASGELYRATSSLKYKENVTDYNKGLAEVLQLRPVYYNVKREDDNNLYAGLIAEEIEELGLTEFVQYAEDGTPDAIYYANMISLMTKAIQELSAKVTALENKI